MKNELTDTVVYESYDTFSAWPILFDKPDSVGLLFDKHSELEAPFDRCYISFTFFAKEGGRANPAPAYPLTVLIGSVLRWRIAKEGLWIRGGFSETPDIPQKDLPIKSIQDRLRTAIKAGRIGLTWASFDQAKQRTELVKIEERLSYVKHLPVLAFALYEKETYDEKTLAARLGLPAKQ